MFIVRASARNALDLPSAPVGSVERAVIVSPDNLLVNGPSYSGAIHVGEADTWTFVAKRQYLELRSERTLSTAALFVGRSGTRLTIYSIENIFKKHISRVVAETAASARLPIKK
jgi:hypothetical protein